MASRATSLYKREDTLTDFWRRSMYGVMLLVLLQAPEPALGDPVLRRALLDVPDGPGKDEGAALGKHVAEEMLAWRLKDGSERKVQVEARYGRGMWQPTPPNFQPALLPQWPAVVPFALPDLERFR